MRSANVPFTMSNVRQDSSGPTNAATQRLFEELERYAGWLGKDTRSTRLRASVKELGLAIASGKEVSDALLSVQADIKSVGSGAIAPLLRRTMQKIRAELADPMA